MIWVTTYRNGPSKVLSHAIMTFVTLHRKVIMVCNKILPQIFQLVPLLLQSNFRNSFLLPYHCDQISKIPFRSGSTEIKVKKFRSVPVLVRPNFKNSLLFRCGIKRVFRSITVIFTLTWSRRTPCPADPAGRAPARAHPVAPPLAPEGEGNII